MYWFWHIWPAVTMSWGGGIGFSLSDTRGCLRSPCMWHDGCDSESQSFTASHRLICVCQWVTVETQSVRLSPPVLHRSRSTYTLSPRPWLSLTWAQPVTETVTDVSHIREALSRKPGGHDGYNPWMYESEWTPLHLWPCVEYNSVGRAWHLWVRFLRGTSTKEVWTCMLSLLYVSLDKNVC